jgi:Flp pilus assembly protein TadG
VTWPRLWRSGHVGGARVGRRRRFCWPARLQHSDRLRSPDRGSFTAELAAGLPTLVILLLVGLTAVTAVTTKLQCVDAAREAALAAARGEPVEGAGQQVAPPGAEIAVTVAGGRATATVRAPVRTLGARLPLLTVTGSAVAAVEPGVAAGEAGPGVSGEPR